MHDARCAEDSCGLAARRGKSIYKKTNMLICKPSQRYCYGNRRSLYRCLTTTPSSAQKTTPRAVCARTGAKDDTKGGACKNMIDVVRNAGVGWLGYVCNHTKGSEGCVGCRQDSDSNSHFPEWKGVIGSHDDLVGSNCADETSKCFVVVHDRIRVELEMSDTGSRQ